MADFTSTYFLYRRVDGGVRILRCRSLDSVAMIPETIDGMSMVELGAYISSASAKRLEDGVWSGQEEAWTGNPEASGERVKEVHLPDGLVKIGVYAFYNYRNLRESSFSSRVLDWRAGTLTGCTGVRYLGVRVEEGEKSCLEGVLAELRQTLSVNYHREQEVRLVFPRFFEESVENTPARIPETHMHGYGHQYRYCFRQSEFQFLWYDSLFPDVQVQKDEELVIRLALERLRLPYGLVEEHRTAYREYLEAHQEEAAAGTMRRESMEELRWVTEQLACDRGELTQMIITAGKLGDKAMLGYLMDFQHKKFDGAGEDGHEAERPVGKQWFELQKQREQGVGG